VSPREPDGSRPLELLQGADGALLDLIDHLLNQGVVVTGEVVLGLADIDLIYLRVSALLCAADRVLPAALAGADRSRDQATSAFEARPATPVAPHGLGGLDRAPRQPGLATPPTPTPPAGGPPGRPGRRASPGNQGQGELGRAPHGAPPPAGIPKGRGRRSKAPQSGPESAEE